MIRVVLWAAAVVALSCSAASAEQCKFYNHRDHAWHHIPCDQAADIQSNLMTPDFDEEWALLERADKLLKELCATAAYAACDAYKIPDPTAQR